MEQQIEKLIELAKEYYEFGVAIELPTGHHWVRDASNNVVEWAKKGDRINIYLNDNSKTWSIDFGDVSIVGYTHKISIPFDATEEMLDSIYADAKTYLQEYLIPVILGSGIEAKRQEYLKLQGELMQMVNAIK